MAGRETVPESAAWTRRWLRFYRGAVLGLGVFPILWPFTS